MTLHESLTRNPFTISWLTLGILFLFVEAMALWSKIPHSTLSSHVREWVGSQDTWVIWVAWAFMLGLTAHFLVDLKR